MCVWGELCVCVGGLCVCGGVVCVCVCGGGEGCYLFCYFAEVAYPFLLYCTISVGQHTEDICERRGEGEGKERGRRGGGEGKERGRRGEGEGKERGRRGGGEGKERGRRGGGEGKERGRRGEGKGKERGRKGEQFISMVLPVFTY